MYKCEICGAIADIHHIIYRSEGGFDIPINYKYLCANHHRGKNGPHHDKLIDLTYKIELQQNLYKILNKDFYWPKDLTKILNIHSGQLKRLLKDLKIHKEGYSKGDIIFKLLGYKKFPSDLLDEITFEILLDII